MVAKCHFNVQAYRITAAHHWWISDFFFGNAYEIFATIRSILYGGLAFRSEIINFQCITFVWNRRSLGWAFDERNKTCHRFIKITRKELRKHFRAKRSQRLLERSWEIIMNCYEIEGSCIHINNIICSRKPLMWRARGKVRLQYKLCGRRAHTLLQLYEWSEWGNSHMSNISLIEAGKIVKMPIFQTVWPNQSCSQKRIILSIDKMSISFECSIRIMSCTWLPLKNPSKHKRQRKGNAKAEDKDRTNGLRETEKGRQRIDRRRERKRTSVKKETSREQRVIWAVRERQYS